jgi:hypothetical protein
MCVETDPESRVGPLIIARRYSYHYDSHDQLRAHLQLFMDAYNHARRLKTLRGLTPYQFIYQAWTKEPDRFRLNPSHHIPGPYNVSACRFVAHYLLDSPDLTSSPLLVHKPEFGLCRPTFGLYRLKGCYPLDSTDQTNNLN